MKVGDVFQIEGIGVVEIEHGKIESEPMQMQIDGAIWIGVKTIDGSMLIVNECDLKDVVIH